jgi:hypothetical protein
MSTPLLIAIIISLLGLFSLALFSYFRHRQLIRFVLHVFLLLICAFFLYFYFFRAALTARGTEGGNDVAFVIVLYLFMLLGMLAHHLYTRFTLPATDRPKFDFGLFVAPIFASPIIFIPLLSALQNANIDLRQLTTAKLMVFLVAFENGFFWKEYFDHRRQQKAEGKNEAFHATQN